eukprot:gene23411-43919_t
MAACAGGHQAAAGRETVRQLAPSLGGSEGQALARVVQDVLLKRVSLLDAASSLEDAGQRQLAYEMAVCVCDADGRQSDAERAFLTQLKTHLKLDPVAAAAFEREADAIVDAAEKAVPVAVPAAVAAGPVVAASVASGAELDKSILNYA